MVARSYLIESPSKLLVTRTGIKARLSSNLGPVIPLILELLALEWQKFHTFELEYLWSQLANLDQILCVASLGWGKGCIRFWARLTLAHWTQVSDRCPLGYLFFWKCAWRGNAEHGVDGKEIQFFMFNGIRLVRMRSDGKLIYLAISIY